MRFLTFILSFYYIILVLFHGQTWGLDKVTHIFASFPYYSIKCTHLTSCINKFNSIPCQPFSLTHAPMFTWINLNIMLMRSREEKKGKASSFNRRWSHWYLFQLHYKIITWVQVTINFLMFAILDTCFYFIHCTKTIESTYLNLVATIV